MHTVGSAREWAIKDLKAAGEKSPALSADLLIASVIGRDRVHILSHPEEAITPEVWGLIQNMILRRRKGEPLQYLTGVQEFYGLPFRVKPGILIPRPETEILVEKAIQLMGSQAPGARFADIGTGSGCIAVSVAYEVSSAIGCATDLSAAALEMAHANAVCHGVGDRIRLVRSDLLEGFRPVPAFDFILCNPPYVALKDYDSLAAEVRDHEPSMALFGGETGIELYRRLIPEVPARLVPGGYLLMELGAGQAGPIRLLMEKAGMSVESVLNDLQGIPRCLVGRKLPGVGHG